MNARATKKHRAVLDAINTGRVPKFAHGGIAGSSFRASSTYAPSININLTGSSGNRKQDAQMARMVADQVGRTLTADRPDTFRKTEMQRLAETQSAARERERGTTNG